MVLGPQTPTVATRMIGPNTRVKYYVNDYKECVPVLRVKTGRVEALQDGSAIVELDDGGFVKVRLSDLREHVSQQSRVQV